MGSASPPLLRFARAQRPDAPRVLAIVDEAARWLDSKGLRQWAWYLTDEGRASIPLRIVSFETYLVTCDDADAATFTLQWSDRTFWGDRGEDGLAGYVHGLAVRRAYAGRGIGAASLRWATDQIAARGRSFLRLDCMAENARLCQFYRDWGLAEQGIAMLPDRTYQFRLFEKPVS